MLFHLIQLNKSFLGLFEKWTAQFDFKPQKNANG